MPVRPYRLVALVSVLVALVSVLAGLAAGCSSSSSAQMSRAQALMVREGEAPALLYQCALTRGLVEPPDPADVYFTHAAVLGTKVRITPSNSELFADWVIGKIQVTLAGETLGYWQQWAADNDKLPTAVCGRVSASALEKQVYAKYPSALDAWHT
jgi:hypothetical protein